MNNLAHITLAAALSFSALHLARADQPGPDWMPAQQVIEQVLKSGYTQVTKIEAEDGRWEGEGIKNGKKMEFHADPKTGVITTENLDQPGPDWMPVQQVVEQVLKSGYTQITKLEADDGRWEGEGIKNGQKMAFQADPKTGVITTEKPDDEDD
jgi:Peptidase propeptide and YPEB domain